MRKFVEGFPAGLPSEVGHRENGVHALRDRILLAVLTAPRCDQVYTNCETINELGKRGQPA